MSQSDMGSLDGIGDAVVDVVADTLVWLDALFVKIGDVFTFEEVELDKLSLIGELFTSEDLFGKIS